MHHELDDKKGADEGAAGNMEKHICLEGVKALYAVGLVVQTLVVDGDTKGLEWVKAHGPAEVAACIGTQLDLNHISTGSAHNGTVLFCM